MARGKKSTPSIWQNRKKKGEIIAQALKERDASAIKELFYDYAKNEIKKHAG